MKDVKEIMQCLLEMPFIDIYAKNNMKFDKLIPNSQLYERNVEKNRTDDILSQHQFNSVVPSTAELLKI